MEACGKSIAVASAKHGCLSYCKEYYHRHCPSPQHVIYTYSRWLRSVCAQQVPQIRLLSILLRSPLVIQLIHSPPPLVVSWKKLCPLQRDFGINARDMLRAYKVVCFLRVFLVNAEIWCDKTPPHTTSLHSSSCTISWNNDKIQEWRPILYNFQFEVTANAFLSHCQPLIPMHLSQNCTVKRLGVFRKIVW